MPFINSSKTWKIVYHPHDMENNQISTAFVNADSHQQALMKFMQQYQGQCKSIERCEKVSE